MESLDILKMCALLPFLTLIGTVTTGKLFLLLFPLCKMKKNR